MKLLNILIFLFLISLISCSTTKSYKKDFSANDFKNETCPDFKIEYYKSEASGIYEVKTVDVLPVFFDMSLKNTGSQEHTNEKEILRKQLKTIVLKSLNKHNIPNQLFDFNNIDSLDVNNYKKSVRRSSFAFAHGQYVPKEYYTKSISKIGSERYKLAFYFQFFPKLNKDYERIYVHVLIYDTEVNKNVYYDYLIYEQCSIRNLNNFSSVLNKMVSNLKKRKASKNSE